MMTVVEMRLVFSKDRLEERVQELAAEISRDYAGRNLVLVGVLNGVFMFFADLVKKLSIPVRIEFIRLSSYGEAMDSSGRIEMKKNVESDLSGLDVLIVEDIADSGLTLNWLHKHLEQLGAASVKTCVLIDKKERRDVSLNLEYVGFEVDTGFLVGYGLDYDGQYRHLPEVYHLVMA
ncbi:MAG: hypoxanthine phosphoribosyltransferase [Pseudomonadota bacterium]